MLNEPPSGLAARFSVIIAVYNDWQPLRECLRSLREQRDAPSFEVIVVDDGSDSPAPPELASGLTSVILLRQNHWSIAAARNHGIKAARGSLVLFTDADCRLQPDCLSALDRAVADCPQYDCFQLKLAGDSSSVVGRAEELHLRALQHHRLQPDGRIRFLNTAGFAIRRSRIDAEIGLFDPTVLRGEDTLLLAHLLQRNDMPFFVANAIAQHASSLSIIGCLFKDLRSAWLEAKTDRIIDASGIQVQMRMSDRERLYVLRKMWETARDESIGRRAWLFLLVRRLLNRIVSLSSHFLPESAKRNRRHHASPEHV